MRSENGIPRPFQPNNLAQKVADLERDLKELKARRTFVSVERIVEGGTINENVGKQITDTVQKDIVIDGGNLGEGALDGQRMVGAIIETNDAANRGVKIDDTGLRGYDADGNRYMKADETGLEMTGSISTKGKTAEEVPRDITVRMTTVSRTFDGQADVPNPGLVFETSDTPLGLAPGIYSPDGRILTLATADVVGAISSMQLGPLTTIIAREVVIGPYLAPLFRADFAADSVTVGRPSSIFSPTPPPAVNLVGNVKVNGTPVTKMVTPNIPAGAQQIELVATGSAMTSSAGEFTINFPADTFPTACIAIFIVPNSGGGTIPVVNGTGALTKTNCRAVQPGNGNKSITYSYRAIGY